MTTTMLDAYASVIASDAIRELRLLAAPLRGRRLVMVNSTKVGGGVAEMLMRFVPMLAELGIDVRWEVIRGNAEFYRVTKPWHNAIHGAPVHLTAGEGEIFVETNRQNALELDLEADVVAIHDPQPAALIEVRKPDEARRWVWRCHIDASTPAPGVWDFLSSYLTRYDAAILSAPAFTRPMPTPQYLFYPSIEPFAEKNVDLDPKEVEAVLDRLHVPRDTPYLVQVSRYDRLEDPLGVLELPPDAHHDIDALQRGAAIVLQKSLREGFGLTVTEGLWKAKPMVASATGGIPLQIMHGVTGLLCRSPEGCAYQVRYLLERRGERGRLGATGREWVREQYFITRNLRRWLLLLHALERPGERVITLP